MCGSSKSRREAGMSTPPHCQEQMEKPHFKASTCPAAPSKGPQCHSGWETAPGCSKGLVRECIGSRPLRDKQPRHVTATSPVACRGQNLGQGSSAPRGEGWAHPRSRAQLDARPGMAVVVWATPFLMGPAPGAAHETCLTPARPGAGEAGNTPGLSVCSETVACTRRPLGLPSKLGCLRARCQAGEGRCPRGHDFCSACRHAWALHPEAGPGRRASRRRRWAKATASPDCDNHPRLRTHHCPHSTEKAQGPT